MSKKSRTLKKARTELAGEAVTRVRGPADLVTAIPYLLGHEPRESLVVMSLTGKRREVGPAMRLDLVTPGLLGTFIEYVCELVAVQGWNQVVLATYSEDRAAADSLMIPLVACLQADQVTIIEGLGAGGGRWWSYLCCNPDCCPPEGVLFDPSASPLAASMVTAGLTKAPDRDALRSQVAPAADEMRQAVKAVCDELMSEPAEMEARWDEGAVEQRVKDALGLGSLDARTCGELLAMVQLTVRRDVAWTMMTRKTASQHFELWRQVTRLAPDHLLAPAGSLAGFAAWLSGNGVLASHAADRVAEVAPEYSMMHLLREALVRCVNPRVWDRTVDKAPFLS